MVVETDDDDKENQDIMVEEKIIQRKEEVSEKFKKEIETCCICYSKKNIFLKIKNSWGVD